MKSFIEIRDTVVNFIDNNFNISGRIVALQKKDDKWVCDFEIIEEAEYMRRFGKTEIIGLYEVEISLEGEIQGYKRLDVRERGDLNIKTE